MIYLVTNEINGKQYIGFTNKTLNERRKNHIKSSKNGKTHFYNALNKYGIDNFKWEIIDENGMYDMEKYYIKKYNTFKSGYNMTLGGSGGDTISMKSDKEKKNQGAKVGNIPWNKGLSMKELGYDCFKNRKPRSNFTEKQKQEHSLLIKQSKRYRNGIKNRKITGRQVKVKRLSDGKIWDSVKEFREETGISGYQFRTYIRKDGNFGNDNYEIIPIQLRNNSTISTRKSMGEIMDEETRYHTGDVVTINNIDWIIESVTMRFGKIMNYALKYKDESGDGELVNIETGSLETLIKLGES